MSPTAGVEKNPFLNNLHPGEKKKKDYVLSAKYEKCIPYFGKPSMHPIFHFRLLYSENIYYHKS